MAVGDAVEVDVAAVEVCQICAVGGHNSARQGGGQEAFAYVAGDGVVREDRSPVVQAGQVAQDVGSSRHDLGLVLDRAAAAVIVVDPGDAARDRLHLLEELKARLAEQVVENLFDLGVVRLACARRR